MNWSTATLKEEGSEKLKRNSMNAPLIFGGKGRVSDRVSLIDEPLPREVRQSLDQSGIAMAEGGDGGQSMRVAGPGGSDLTPLSQQERDERE